MTPPPSAALALLGVWVLLMFWTTATTATTRTHTERRLEPTDADDQSDRATDRSDRVADTASANAFSAADD
ncbi:hypothetical protein [Natrinema sp. 74]|uniref:hypothetical protein n=1 Tax=Natrinema sp. 74 TaxID=3384159 RepID=UPI0038D3E85A